MQKKVKWSLLIILISMSIINVSCQSDFQDKVTAVNNETKINTPKASGAVVYGKNGITIDASNAGEGYLMIRHTDSQKRLKARILKGDKTYTYDLNNQREFVLIIQF